MFDIIAMESEAKKNPGSLYLVFEAENKAFTLYRSRKKGIGMGGRRSGGDSLSRTYGPPTGTGPNTVTWSMVGKLTVTNKPMLFGFAEGKYNGDEYTGPAGNENLSILEA